MLRAPRDSPRRTQEGGLYAARLFGPPGRQVKLVLLDTRYGRDSHALPSVGASRWLPKAGYVAAMERLGCAALGLGRNHEGDVLGEAQWRWLRSELTNSSAQVHPLRSPHMPYVANCSAQAHALLRVGTLSTPLTTPQHPSQVHLIVSSVQLLTSNPLVESWGHFPVSKARLLALLAEARPAAALVLSGDVHFAEFLGPAAAAAAAASPISSSSSSAASSASSTSSSPSPPSAASLSSLLEVTSSGLTHSCGLTGLARLACGTVLDLFYQHRLQLARPPAWPNSPSS